MWLFRIAPSNGLAKSRKSLKRLVEGICLNRNRDVLRNATLEIASGPDDTTIIDQIGHTDIKITENVYIKDRNRMKEKSRKLGEIAELRLDPIKGEKPNCKVISFFDESPESHPESPRRSHKNTKSEKAFILGAFRDLAESPGVTSNKNVIRACGIGTVQHALLKKQQNPREGSAVFSMPYLKNSRTRVRALLFLIGLRKYGMV